jgi:Flp pilus assembly protein TadD
MSSPRPAIFSEDRLRGVEPEQGLLRRLGRNQVILGLLLIAGILWVYKPVAHLRFTEYDDPDYVTYNDDVIGGLSLAGVKYAFTTTRASNWHPLTWLSHMLDCQLFGLNPAGPHLENLLLHTWNALLVFLLLHRATRKIAASFAVAVLFAVHPLNVESVAWISERKNVLSTFFLLLTLAVYGWHAKKPKIATYVAVIGVYALGLMAKPMLVTLPVLLLLVDYWPLKRLSWATVLEKAPLAALAVGSCVMTIIAQRAGNSVRSTVMYPLLNRLENALLAYTWYLRKMIWPSQLAVFYPHPKTLLPAWQVFICSGILLIITVAVLAMRKIKPWLVTGWFWYLIALLPVIGIVQVGDQAVADRYAYVPLLGVFVCVAWLVLEWCEQLHWRQATTATIAVVAFIACCRATVRQIAYWQDGVSLFTHDIAVVGASYLAEDNLGEALAAAGKPEEAIAQLRVAGADTPANGLAHFEVATALLNRGRLQEALNKYRIVPYMTNDKELAAQAYNNAAVALVALGRSAEAERDYQAAIAEDPNAYPAEQGIAELLYRQGKFEESRSHFQKSLAIQPTAAAYVGLGKDFEALHRSADAQSAYQSALKISPGMREAADRARALQAIVPRMK